MSTPLDARTQRNLDLLKEFADKNKEISLAYNEKAKTFTKVGILGKVWRWAAGLVLRNTNPWRDCQIDYISKHIHNLIFTDGVRRYLVEKRGTLLDEVGEKLLKRSGTSFSSNSYEATRIKERVNDLLNESILIKNLQNYQDQEQELPLPHSQARSRAAKQASSSSSTSPPSASSSPATAMSSPTLPPSLSLLSPSLKPGFDPARCLNKLIKIGPTDGQQDAGVFGRNNGCHLASVLQALYFTGAFTLFEGPNVTKTQQLLNAHILEPLQAADFVSSSHFDIVRKHFNLNYEQHDLDTIILNLHKQGLCDFQISSIPPSHNSLQDFLDDHTKASSSSKISSPIVQPKPCFVNAVGSMQNINKFEQHLTFKNKTWELGALFTLNNNHWRAYLVTSTGQIIEHNSQYAKQDKPQACIAELEAVEFLNSNLLQESSFYYDPKAKKFISIPNKNTALNFSQFQNTLAYLSSISSLLDKDLHIPALQLRLRTELDNIQRGMTPKEEEILTLNAQIDNLPYSDGGLTSFMRYTGLLLEHGKLVTDRGLSARDRDRVDSDSEGHRQRLTHHIQYFLLKPDLSS